MTFFLPPIFLLLFFFQEGGAPIRVHLASKGWYLGARPLARGDGLSAVAEVTAKEPGDLMLECGPAGAILYTCTRVPCRVPVCSTRVEGVAVRRLDSGGAPSMLSNFLASLRKREPKAPETLGVRGSGGVNDAVIFENAGMLHLAPALRRVLEGKHCFRLTPLSAAGAARTFPLDWDRSIESEGLAKVANLTPGAYALEVSHIPGGCEFDDPDNAPAWVVVTKQTDFSSTEAQWKSYAPWLRELEQSGVSPAVVLTMRHALLSALGDAVEKP